MIRRATLEDIPRLLEMGEKFAEKARLEFNVGYDPASMEDTFSRMIQADEPVFIGEAGAIGALTFPHPFNRAHWGCQELFWWSEGREGMRLLKALTSYCEEHCHSLTMITLEAIKPEEMGRLYRRLGFRPLEHSYIKVF